MKLTILLLLLPFAAMSQKSIHVGATFTNPLFNKSVSGKPGIIAEYQTNTDGLYYAFGGAYYQLLENFNVGDGLIKRDVEVLTLTFAHGKTFYDGLVRVGGFASATLSTVSNPFSNRYGMPFDVGIDASASHETKVKGLHFGVGGRQGLFSQRANRYQPLQHFYLFAKYSI